MHTNERKILRSFAELGSAFNLPQPLAPPDFLELFRQLPLQEKLSDIYSMQYKSKDPDLAKTMTGIAIQEVLEMSKKDRERSNIQVVAFAPVDIQEQRPTVEVLTYPLYVIFLHKQIQDLKYVQATRISTANTYSTSIGPLPDLGTLRMVDSLVFAGAQLRPESLIDRCNRLVQEVKLVDSLIKGEKVIAETRHKWYSTFRVDRDKPRIPTTDKMRELNLTKTERVYRYLLEAGTLQVENPYLEPIFVLSSSNAQDINHSTLEMWLVRDRALYRRLLDPEVQPIAGGIRSMVSTNINLKDLMSARARFSSGSTIESDERAYKIIAMLGL